MNNKEEKEGGTTSGVVIDFSKGVKEVTLDFSEVGDPEGGRDYKGLPLGIQEYIKVCRRLEEWYSRTKTPSL